MIYLVEDNDALRRSLIAMLTEGDPQRVSGWASTEREATEWLQQHHPAWRLAVVDLFLLQGSGLGVVSQLRQREPGQKVVVLTHYATPDIRRRALALGADAVFDKGKEMDAFLDYCQHAAPLPAPPRQAPS